AQPYRQGQPGVGKLGNQDQVEDLGQHQDEQGNAHRCTDILLGIEAWGQDLDGQQTNQAHGIRHDGQPGLHDIGGAESTIVEQGGNQSIRQQGQAQGGRQAQQQYQAQAPIQQRAVAVVVLPGVCGRKPGQQHSSQGNAQQGGGKLHQPVGKRKPGHAARRQPGGNVGVDEQGYLCNRHPKYGGQHLPHDVLDGGVCPGGAHFW